MSHNPTDTEDLSLETSASTAEINHLRANAQYVIFVQTINAEDHASEPSETIVAWTDPIVPAYAEVRIISVH